MSKLIVYYAHPGHKYSHVNRDMAAEASQIDGITYVDLYKDYPRFDIDVETEQHRLMEHDVVLMQFPMFWYSTPSILKEWQDLVLEHGFAYGSGGDRLEGKRLQVALTAAGPEDAYSAGGYQHYPIRDFLRPLEQTARLCGMEFPAPLVLFSSLKAPSDGTASQHVAAYRSMLMAVRDDQYDWDAAAQREFVDFDTLPIRSNRGQEG